MKGFGMAAMARRQQQKREGKAPKGFDIIMADVISNYNLSEEEIQKLGELTVKRKIAYATVGHQVWYRSATIERLFDREQVKVQ